MRVAAVSVLVLLISCLTSTGNQHRIASSTVLTVITDNGLKCSAVKISARRALTAAHCFSASAERAVLLPDIGYGIPVEGILPLLPRDLAIVTTAVPMQGPFAVIRDGAVLGDYVVSYGACAPTSKEHVVVQSYDDKLIAHGLQSVCPGDSGGGWFDAQGRLVGITSMKLSKHRSLAVRPIELTDAP